MRILVVEDYAPVRKAVVQGLEEAGFAVDATGDGNEGLWYASSSDYDVVILDIMLPGSDGLTILKEIREAKSGARVLILTAKDTVADRVNGLNLGADDYLVKPFDFSELLARVKALVRRKYDKGAPILRIADLEIDTVGRTVRRNGQPTTLTARDYSLIEYLAQRAGEVVSRSDIWEHIYDFHSSATSNVVDVYIGYLRKKIERPGTKKIIYTRRGYGYGYVLGEID